MRQRVSDAVALKSPKNVNKKLIIFIDPDCPYCRQLEREIVKQNISAKADIYYMLMPISIHPKAKQHTANILCSKDQIAVLKDYMVNNLENPKVQLIPDCNIEPILERTGSLARVYGINAVPVIVTGTGEMIMGADINAIQNYLGK